MLKYDRKELAKYYVGCPVEYSTSLYEYPLVGHVTGFGLNVVSEVLILITGMSGEIAVHPHYVTPLSE